jgi:hypothetical protein
MRSRRLGTVAERGGPELPGDCGCSRMTATALSAALNTSHRSMPNILLEPDDQAHIIAYILSLKWVSGKVEFVALPTSRAAARWHRPI